MLRNRRGFAVMLVVWMIAVLGTVSAGVALRARSTTDVTANYRARVMSRYAAESGIALAVATLQDSLAGFTDAAARRAYLNQLDAALGGNAQIELGDARVAVALVDVGAQLDVNFADAASLATLFGYFTDAIEAERMAAAVRAVTPLESLDQLADLPGVRREVMQRAVEYLTVDGDGTINRASASDTVLAAATGELRDEPSRIIVVSRGWRDGHALTHEIQAVYAITENELVLVRWRERDL